MHVPQEIFGAKAAIAMSCCGKFLCYCLAIIGARLLFHPTLGHPNGDKYPQATHKELEYGYCGVSSSNSRKIQDEGRVAGLVPYYARGTGRDGKGGLGGYMDPS